MELSDKERKKVIKVLKRKLLKDSPRYQLLKKVVLGCTVSLGVLACSTGYLDGSIAGVIADALTTPVTAVIGAGSFWLFICNWAAKKAIELHIPTLEDMFSNFEDLMSSIGNEPMSERKDNMNEVVGYMKDGSPIIDVPFVEVPEGEESECSFEPYEAPTKIIDVDFYPIGEVTLADKILLLMDYAQSVAYPNYEADITVLDTMHEYVYSGAFDELTKASLEKTLSILELSIFNQACKMYDLPLVRKLG